MRALGKLLRKLLRRHEKLLRRHGGEELNEV